jgi:gluconokinase
MLQHLVVMGVAGSGKTTIAAALASQLQCSFADGDDLHPQHNVAKMARGEPLTDVDREPWLQAVAAWIAARHASGSSTVVACSALKRRYRDTLRQAAPRVAFVHLDVPAETLHERLQRRRGHFMPASLLDSQLATLEPLQPDELGFAVEATGPPAAVVAMIVAHAKGDGSIFPKKGADLFSV